MGINFGMVGYEQKVQKLTGSVTAWIWEVKKLGRTAKLPDGREGKGSEKNEAKAWEAVTGFIREHQETAIKHEGRRKELRDKLMYSAERRTHLVAGVCYRLINNPDIYTLKRLMDEAVDLEAEWRLKDGLEQIVLHGNAKSAQEVVETVWNTARELGWLKEDGGLAVEIAGLKRWAFKTFGKEIFNDA